MDQVTGTILSIDLGVRMGFAAGKPGAAPRSWTVVLKKDGDQPDVAFSNLIFELGKILREYKPQVLLKEAAFSYRAMIESGSSDAKVRVTYGLHAIVEGMARRFGVVVVEKHRATVLKHFTGHGRYQSREAGKMACQTRAHQLGWMPREVKDWDRADALAGWDWASTHLGRRPAGLVLSA